MNFLKSWKLIVTTLTLLAFILLPFARHVEAQFSTDLGSISGNVTWGTENPDTQFRIRFVGNTTGYTTYRTTNVSVSNNSFDTGFNLPQDTYTITLAKNQEDAPNYFGYVVGSQTLILGSGQAATANFDITSATGFVRGNLKINGVDSPGYVQFCGQLQSDPCPISPTSYPFNYNNGPWDNFNEDGFNLPILPGNYRVHVITPSRVDVGIVPISVTAGVAESGTSLQFQLNLGSISGNVIWGAETYSSGGYRVRSVGTTTGFTRYADASYGIFSTGFNIPPDTYTVTVAKQQEDAPNYFGFIVGSQTVVVEDGQSVTANFDISNVTGFVKGALTINGVPSPGYVQFCGPLETDPCPILTGTSYPFIYNNGPWTNFNESGFKMPLLPGDYRVHVITPSKVNAGILPITVVAGQILDNSSLQFQYTIFGSISGTVTWGTESLSPRFRVRSVGNTSNFTIFNTTLNDTFSTGFNLPADTYTVTLAKEQEDAPNLFGFVIGNQTWLVGAGQAVVANFDIMDSTGLVKGDLKVNDVASPGYVQFCGPLESDPCPISMTTTYPYNYNDGPWSDFNEYGFSIPLLPGDYRVHVITPSRVDAGIIPVTVIPGQVAILPFTDNQPPTADANGPYNVNEGQSVQVSAVGNDPENGPLNYAWDLDNNGSFETSGQSVTFLAAGLDGPSSYTITIAVQVTDDGNLTATDQAEVGIFNVAPSVGTITAPMDPVSINTTIFTSASFTDAGVPDTHGAVWDWGDNTTSVGLVDQVLDTVTGSHYYTAPGVYTVKLAVTDDDEGSGESIYQFVVVYDSSVSGGFVTGAGTIDSLAGAYTAQPLLAGIARFGFVSKYQPGASVPTGNTQFRFQVAQFTFSSTDYEWLVVAGPQAKYKGTGTVNGGGNYGFLLSATDGAVRGGGGVDKFRIKIWDKDNNDTVVYDNQLGSFDNADPTTAITGGNIVIH